jgi:CBS domain containing-hemolysin-like protein
MTAEVAALLGLAMLLIGANALFVAAEFSLVTVDRTTVEAQAPTSRAAARVLTALRGLSTQLSGAQLGITVSSLVVGFLAEPSLAALLAPALEALGLGSGGVTPLALTLALLIATVVQMVFGELVPKNWAIAEPMRVAKAVTPPHMAFTTATGPLIRVLNGSANKLLRAMGIEPTEELSSARSPQELQSLIRRSASEGTLDRPVASLLDRSLKLTDRLVADVLTPWFLRPRATPATPASRSSG